MSAFSKTVEQVPVVLPAEEGDWVVEVELLEPQSQEKRPVSSWRVRTLQPVVPAGLKKLTIVRVPERETELREFLEAAGIRTAGLKDPSASIVLTGLASWQHLESEVGLLEAAVMRGASVVMLDVGPRDLGLAYFPEGDARPHTWKCRTSRSRV